MKSLLALLAIGTIACLQPASAEARDRHRHHDRDRDRHECDDDRRWSHHSYRGYRDRHHRGASPRRDRYGHRVDSHGHHVDRYGNHIGWRYR